MLIYYTYIRPYIYIFICNIHTITQFSMNSFKFLDTPLFLRKMTRQRHLWMSLPTPRLVMSSGSISKGVYPPVVQMRSPGCQWQDNEKASSMDWSLRSVSWSLQPKSSQDDWRVWRASTSQEGKVGTLIFFSRSWHCQRAIVSSWAWEHWPETIPFPFKVTKNEVIWKCHACSISSNF